MKDKICYKRFRYYDTNTSDWYNIEAEDMKIDGSYLKFINVNCGESQKDLYIHNANIKIIEAY